MTEDSRDMKLGLPLSYPNPSVRTRIETSSGAGVNADSRIDTTLMEHRTENIPSFPWDAGPSNMTLAHDGKSIGDQKVTQLPVEPTVNSEAGLPYESSRTHHSGMSGAMVEANPIEECAVHFKKKQECNHEEKAFCCQNDDQSEDIARSKTDAAAGRRNKNIDDALPLLECKTKDVSSSKDVSSGNQMLDIKARGFEKAPMEGLESSAENEVLHVIENNAFGQSEKGSRVESSYPAEVSGTLEENKINMLHEKGKQIILFGKNINESTSKSEDDSHDSVESSNSATLSSKEKKRRNFEKQLIVGSKRIKSLPQEAPTLTSSTKPDSSFVNWISNMVKGLVKANQDECPLALGLGHPRDRLNCYDQQNQACNNIQDPGRAHMGFQSMFRSLYCPKTIETARRPSDNPSVSAKESMESHKSFINVMPISFYRENDESCNKLLMDNNNSDHHTSGGNGGDPSIQTSSQPHILSVNNDSTPETSKTKSIEKKNLTTLTCSNEKEALRSIDTWLDKQKTVSFEDKSLHIPSEGEAMPNIFSKNDLSRSLWITRFSSRTPTPALDSDQCNNAEIKLEDSSGLIKHGHSNSSFSSRTPMGKDKLKYPTNLQASIGFNRVVEHNHKNPLCRIDSRPPTFKSLEPMASAFARRLEVLKSIPSVTRDDPTPFRIKCLYCGRSGHGLVSCSEVQKSDLVDLMKNISSNDAANGSDHRCIKCLQLGHLAISCSIASSSRQQQSHKNAPIHMYQTADTVKIYKSSEPYSSMLFTKESHCKVPSDHSTSSGHKTPGSERRVTCRDDVQNDNSSCYKGLEVKENQVSTLCKSISCDALNIFEAVRKLRLSRTDILKWMNLNRPLVHLNGYFLRLRLRKWETKLGGTGYYVACINGRAYNMVERNHEKWGNTCVE
ncbi:uncharacterized protein LOC141683065 isoform X3 [Apium graveolens]|uniref:uncharacterized protein LOC141683065 isoform X3 n=1 Tax=Apium graveolens TaxID=4045 RepID=UPI003D7BA3E5